MVEKESRWQTLFFSSLLYCCRFYRNKIVHEGEVDFAKTVFMFNRMVEEFLREESLAGLIELLDQRKGERMVGWTPPLAGV